MNNIIGIESAYREAIDKPDEDIKINSNLLVGIIERLGELENAVIGLKAVSRNVKNLTEGVLKQHKDL